MATADMMTQLATLVQGGIPPEQAIQYLRDAQAQQFAKMPVKEQLASNIGMYAGRVGQGLLRAAGVEDPMLAQASKMRDLATQFDTSTAEGMMQYAKALQSVNPALAQQAAAKARELALEESKLTTEKARQGQIAAQEKRALAEVAERKSKETAAEAAARSRAKALLKKFPEMSEEEASALSDDPKVFAELVKVPKKEAVKTEVTTANGRRLLINKDTGETIKDLGVAGKTLEESLGAGLAQVAGFNTKGGSEVLKVRKDLLDTVKPYREGIDAADNAISLLDAGLKQGNFSAVASAQRALAKAAGETQISAADVKAFDDPSLIGMASDTISRLVTGTPTADTLKQMKVVATIMKKKNEERLKAEETMAKRTAARTGAFKEEDIADLFQLRTPAAPKQIKLKSGIVVTRED